jgi:hypothetical protein
MNERRFRTVFHSAIGEVPTPPDLQARARQALGRPVEPRPSRVLQALAAAAAVLLVAGIVAFNLVSHYNSTVGNHPRPVAHPSPSARALSAYQQLVKSDWQPVADDFAAAGCPLPAPKAGIVNPAPVLPIDTPTCRSQSAAEKQAAEKMAADLRTATPPQSLSDAHTQLQIDLDAHIAALAAAIAAFDNQRPADYNPNVANGTYDAARIDVALILR